MLARVATYNNLSDDLKDEAVECLRRIIRETPGYHAGYHMRDPESGKALSVLIMEDEEAFRSVGERLRERPEHDRVGVDPDDIEFFEVSPY